MNTIVGLKKGTVKLFPYSSAWKHFYDLEEEALRSSLDFPIVDIQHIGSTSIPGLDAKPIIDIALVLFDLDDLQKCMKLLETLGYEYLGEYGLPGRHFFTKGNPITHHLHVVENNSDLLHQWLSFRDYLRQHKKVAEQYNEFKKSLAQKFASNREAYTEGKTPFINKILEMAEESKLDT